MQGETDQQPEINSNMGYIETIIRYSEAVHDLMINSNMGYIETSVSGKCAQCTDVINSNMGYIETLGMLLTWCWLL